VEEFQNNQQQQTWRRLGFLRASSTFFVFLAIVAADSLGRKLSGMTTSLLRRAD
jgi:hypothetical protein